MAETYDAIVVGARVAGDPRITRSFLGITSGATDVRAFNRAAPVYLLRGLQLSLRALSPR